MQSVADVTRSEKSPPGGTTAPMLLSVADVSETLHKSTFQATPHTKTSDLSTLYILAPFYKNQSLTSSNSSKIDHIKKEQTNNIDEDLKARNTVLNNHNKDSVR